MRAIKENILYIMKTLHYVSPSVEMISVEMERGFAVTGNLDDFGHGGDLSGDN